MLPEFLLEVVTSREHFLTEGDNVRGLRQVEVFVAPHLPRWSSSRLYLVYQQGGPRLTARTSITGAGLETAW